MSDLRACNRDSSHPAAVYDVPTYRSWIEALNKYDNAYKDYTNSDIYQAYKTSYDTLSTSGAAGQIRFYTIRMELINSESRKIYDAACKAWDIAYTKFKDARATYIGSEKYKEFIQSRRGSPKESESSAFKQFSHLMMPRRMMMERTLNRYRSSI